MKVRNHCQYMNLHSCKNYCSIKTLEPYRTYETLSIDTGVIVDVANTGTSVHVR